MRFGSLFTGIGGFDLGFERAGMKSAWQVEIDKFCAQVLEKQFKDVRRYEDVREVGKHNLEPVDLICGGFPCQDLSVVGKRKGLDGERSGLWFEFARIVEELKPEWVVIENVPGLLSSRKGEDFAIIIQTLVQLGYGVCWRILDSQYFGVPQRRRRVFIVGSLGSGCSAEVLFEQTNNIENVKMEKQRATVIGSLRARGDGELHGGAKLIEDNIGIRFITPLECERLQGFPDNWTDICSDTQRYKQLGNAVTVNVIEWLGRRIVGADPCQNRKSVV